VLDSFQIFTFTVSAIVSLALIFFFDDDIQSVILGFVLAAFFQVFDLQLRNAASEERLLEANAVSHALYQDDWLFSQVQQIAFDYLTIDKDVWFEPLRTHAKERLEDCKDDLHSIAEGYLRDIQRQPIGFGRAALQSATSSIKATAAADVAFWRSNRGKRYHEENAAAARRGIEIIRIFVHPLETLRDIIDIMEAQQNDKIKVHVAISDKVSRELNHDYLIMDECLYIGLELAGDGTRKGERISIDEIEVKRVAREFEYLLGRSETLDDFKKSLQEMPSE
jgi:hypothetical protein